MRIYGVDFTCAPRPAKSITVAAGLLRGDLLTVEDVERIETFAAFEAFLRRPGPWIGGFDFPFGLSREAVVDLKWPARWAELLDHLAALGRDEFKRVLDRYRESRPAGDRYAKRRGDAASGAHPSVKLVNPPVGLMFFEGARRLLHAGLHVPGLHAGDPLRVALEAYPGLLVRKLEIGDSYKSDEARKQTPERLAVRRRILAALAAGRPLGVRVALPKHVAAPALEDGSGDTLDAIICAVQASWARQRQQANFGLPADVDPLEGWIVTA